MVFGKIYQTSDFIRQILIIGSEEYSLVHLMYSLLHYSDIHSTLRKVYLIFRIRLTDTDVSLVLCIIVIAVIHLFFSFGKLVTMTLHLKVVVLNSVHLYIIKLFRRWDVLCGLNWCQLLLCWFYLGGFYLWWTLLILLILLILLFLRAA